MLKLSSSIYKFLFATFLVFFCFNGQQLVYASNLVLDKDHLNAIVEVPKVDSSQTSATGSSTAIYKFDLDFDVGETSEYGTAAKKFKLTIGKSCNLNVAITKDDEEDEKIFRINKALVKELKSLTITNEKVITIPKLASQGSSILCDPQDSDSGGSVVFENPANDPGKSTIELTISGDAINVPDFKLTSSAQIYVSPNSSGSKGDSSNGNGSGDGSMSEKEKLGDTIGNICWYLAVPVAVLLIIFIAWKVWADCIKGDDDGEPENKKGNKKKKRKNESKV